MLKKIVPVILAILIIPISAFPCTGIMGTPITWVHDSEAILRVRAAEERGPATRKTFQQLVEWARATGRDFDTTVRFDVLERIKGNWADNFIELEGTLYDHDDPNAGPVPYTFVRNQGRSGNCFAFSYKQGAEYLFILGRAQRGPRNGELTPYWQSLAATNEQLFGVDDKWLAWVRSQLRGAQR
jgi:hypothetical protein